MQYIAAVVPMRALARMTVGWLTTFLFGFAGAALATVAQRTLWRSLSLAT